MPEDGIVHRRPAEKTRGRRVLFAIAIAIAAVLAVWAGFIGDFAMLVIALVVGVALVAYYAYALRGGSRVRT